ncbi:hypothetical protein ADJ70_11375 [Olsenella sp. oral taxon 807]|nr:hypothetical protein ADJ70_11375 [Olsenella sp. oral taxon 807]
MRYAIAGLGGLFLGMSRTAAYWPHGSGSRVRTNDRNGLAAAWRWLRVATELPRSASRWSGNAPTAPASMSASPKRPPQRPRVNPMGRTIASR